jgi:hypothetical protein
MRAAPLRADVRALVRSSELQPDMFAQVQSELLALRAGRAVLALLPVTVPAPAVSRPGGGARTAPGRQGTRAS